MIHPSAATFRLFLHVLAATVWVGGQITLGGLVPKLRRISPDAPRIVARQFAFLAWPAYGLLVITGMWNILAVEPDWSTAYGITLFVKVMVVALAGIGAFMHSVSRSRAALAIWGAVGSLASIAALFLGVLLHG